MANLRQMIRKWLGVSETEIVSTDLKSLPKVGLGSPLPSDTPFKGCERPFFELYANILGDKRVRKILALHGFERSALYGLHNEAVKLKAIPKAQLLDLADGNTEIIGFAFQPPTLAISWERPFEHYKAEMILGKALPDPVTEE